MPGGFGVFYARTTMLLEKLSIEKKLILSVVLLLAVPIILLGVLLIQNVKSSAEADSLRSAREEVRRAELNIDKNAEICSRAAQMIINNRSFLSFISSDEEYNAEDLIRFRSDALANIQSISSVNPDIYSIRIFLENPNLFEMWGILYHESRIMDEDWREDTIRANGMYCWRLDHPYKSMALLSAPNPPGEVVSLTMDVYYPDKRHQGILEINMLSSTFFSDMYNEGDREDSFLCLVENGGGMIYNTGSTFVSGNRLDIAALQARLAGRASGDEGGFSLKLGDKSLNVVYTRIDALDSYLCLVSSDSSLMKKLDRVRNLILLGIVIGIVLLSLMVYLIVSTLMKKLKKIIGYMRKVQDGDLNVDIPVFGNDEMGELSFHFRKMMIKIKKLITVVVQKQVAAKDAELKALQSQINKHFIYNVLESVHMLAESHNEYRISEIVTSLGKLMRYSMNWERQCVTLEEEIENVRNYIYLMNTRYGDLLVLKLDIDDSLMKQEVLRMTVQPIVENAVVHGFEQRGQKGTISVSAGSGNGTLYITITDDGTGMGRAALNKLRRDIEPESPGEQYQGGKTGIGLKNVHTRIKLFYGSRYGVEIDSEEFRYSSVTIKLPFRSAWAEDEGRNEIVDRG